jgi:hypothetical protein
MVRLSTGCQSLSPSLTPRPPLRRALLSRQLVGAALRALLLLLLLRSSRRGFA